MQSRRITKLQLGLQAYVDAFAATIPRPQRPTDQSLAYKSRPKLKGVIAVMLLNITRRPLVPLLERRPGAITALAER
jgi:hypothetical protein